MIREWDETTTGIQTHFLALLKVLVVADSILGRSLVEIIGFDL
jgi:hypothetical protein